MSTRPTKNTGPWQDHERTYLGDNYREMTIPQMAAHLNRGEPATRKEMRRLGLKKYTLGRTVEERKEAAREHRRKVNGWKQYANPVKTKRPGRPRTVAPTQVLTLRPPAVYSNTGCYWDLLRKYAS